MDEVEAETDEVGLALKASLAGSVPVVREFDDEDGSGE